MLLLTPFWRFVLIEIAAIVVLGAVAFTVPATQLRKFRAIEAAFDALARHRALSILIVIVLVLGGRMAYWHRASVPMPAIHDEFSYLLAGDTFALGRLTNPTHPMWQHFESFHILQKPTYQSMYPVAQGIVLAIGQRLMGNPWFGVWFSAALMCGAFVWMLQGWLPPRWALLGGLLVAVRIGLFSYWMNSYWGGAPAAIGGALMLGAWPRLQKKARTRDALVLAVGLAILANSRPYEGMILVIPVAVTMLLWLRSDQAPPFRVSALRVLLPIFLVMAATAVAMGIYFQAVTGSAFKMPFTVDRDTYAVAKIFIWQKAGTPPIYRHEVMRHFYLDWEYPLYLYARTFPGWISLVGDKIRDIWAFFLGAGLAIPLLMFPRIVRDRRVRLPLICVVAVFAASAVVWYSTPHYFAPAACALYLLVLQGLRHLRAMRRRTAGMVLGWGIPLICLLSFPLQPAVRQLYGEVRVRTGVDEWTINRSMNVRLDVARKIRSVEGPSLVIVRYAPNHNIHSEWVYNRANIDAAPIVWARDMGPEKNRELIEYFKGRNVWVLEPDFVEPKLWLYTNPEARSTNPATPGK